MTDLTRFRDHCRRMAKKPDQPPADVTLWRRLATEVDAYLAHDPAVVVLTTVEDTGPGLFQVTA